MYYIGVDVSKEVLSVYDGKKSLEFENTKELKSFYHYLKRHFKHFENLVVIFEATGIYSDPLKEFCAANHIKAYILIPNRAITSPNP